MRMRGRTEDVNYTYEFIDPREFGPGCEIDFEHNRVIGVSGTVYQDVRVPRADVERLIRDALAGKYGDWTNGFRGSRR
jgi:hypothetical protein